MKIINYFLIFLFSFAACFALLALFIPTASSYLCYICLFGLGISDYIIYLLKQESQKEEIYF